VSGWHAGVLPAHDPLHAFLTEEVLGQVLGVDCSQSLFDVFHLDTSGIVYRYADRRTGANVVGKFYGNKWINGSRTGDRGLRALLVRREFENAARLRSLGLDCPPHSVVRPLAVSEEINFVLVEDFAPGANLDHYILQAAQHGQSEQLLVRLTDLAAFLADWHSRSRTGASVNMAAALEYLDRVLEHLVYWNIISAEQGGQIERLRDRWAGAPTLEQAQEALVHGDATPTHFLFDGGGNVTAIDLERLQSGDSAVDIGCMAAELKHLFFWYTHDPWASEPYIQHLYARYACCVPQEDWLSLTTRGRFYMGCYALRICRDSWLDLDYRRRLIEIAIGCLQL
jgi:hypothetical protein